MKTLKKLTTLTLSVMMAMTIGCTNKNDDSVTPGNTSTTINQGSWKVTYFIDSGKDETSKFSGYNFTFADNGTLTATNGSITETGTWSTGNDYSQVKLYITFTGMSPFDEITDDWHVTEQNSSVIKLEDVSGGNGGIDYLNFSKI